MGYGDATSSSSRLVLRGRTGRLGVDGTLVALLAAPLVSLIADAALSTKAFCVIFAPLTCTMHAYRGYPLAFSIYRQNGVLFI